MSSFASRAARSVAGLSLAVVPLLSSGCGGLVIFAQGDGECVTKQGTFAVGETFLGPDGCNTCTCDENGSVSCTDMACADCFGPVPPCDPPTSPGCVVESVCSDNGVWGCQQSCDDDCADAPPIDCLAPMGCYYTGPICVGGQYECGELVCDKGCGDAPPDCPPSMDPNCFTYAECDVKGWFCVTECGEPPGACEKQYPEGAELVWYLLGMQCGCVMGEVCSDACDNGPFCEGGPGPNGQCQGCIQDAASSGEQCVYDAVFSAECQNDFECTAYVDCVVNGG